MNDRQINDLSGPGGLSCVPGGANHRSAIVLGNPRSVGQDRLVHLRNRSIRRQRPDRPGFDRLQRFRGDGRNPRRYGLRIERGLTGWNRLRIDRGLAADEDDRMAVAGRPERGRGRMRRGGAQNGMMLRLAPLRRFDHAGRIGGKTHRGGQRAQPQNPGSV